MDELFHVAGFGPAHITDGIVASLLLVRSIVSTRPVGPRDPEVEFFAVIGLALDIHPDGANGNDDGAVASDLASEIHRIAAGRFCGDEHGVNSGAVR